VDENNLHHEIRIPIDIKLKVKWGDNQELTLISIYALMTKKTKLKFFKKKK